MFFLLYEKYPAAWCAYSILIVCFQYVSSCLIAPCTVSLNTFVWSTTLRKCGWLLVSNAMLRRLIHPQLNLVPQQRSECLGVKEVVIVEYDWIGNIGIQDHPRIQLDWGKSTCPVLVRRSGDSCSFYVRKNQPQVVRFFMTFLMKIYHNISFAEMWDILIPILWSNSDLSDHPLAWYRMVQS